MITTSLSVRRVYDRFFADRSYRRLLAVGSRLAKMCREANVLSFVGHICPAFPKSETRDIWAYGGPSLHNGFFFSLIRPLRT